MAITRIKNNQITDGAITAGKIADNSITSGKLENNMTYGSNLTVTGNLTVSGSTVAVDSSTMTVEDPIMLLASNQTGSGATDIGFIGERGDDTNVAFVWDESANTFVAATTSSADSNTTVTVTDYADMHMGGLTADDNATIGGTLGVTGATTTAAITASGLISANAGIAVDTNKFTVADTSGNVATAGTLGVTGATTLSSTLSAGNTTVATLDASGLASLDGGIDVDGAFTVTDSNGNVTTSGTIDATGAITGGSLTDGTATLSSGALSGATTGAFSSNVTVGGTLGITGATTLSSTLNAGASTLSSISVAGTSTQAVINASGLASLDGGIDVDGAFTVADTSGNVVTSGTLEAGNTTVGTLTTTGNTIIGGNLTVNGTTTTVNSTTVSIDDAIFNLGGDSAPASDDNKDRGVQFQWHNGSEAKIGFFGYDDSASEFVFIPDASNSSEVISGSVGSAKFGSLKVSDLTDNRVLIAGASGEIEDSSGLTYDGSTFAVTGAATVSGATTLSSTLSAGASTLASATVTGAATVGTTLGVTGATTLSSTLSAGATDVSTLDASGLASLDGGIDVDGAFTVANSTGNISTSGTATITGTTTLNGALDANSTADISDTLTLSKASGTGLSVTSNATVGGTMAVTGATTLTGLLNADGGIAVDTTNFTVSGSTGAVATASTLDVAGLASLDGGIDVDGAFTVANTTGNISTSGAMSVTGTSTQGVINASGLASLDGGIDVDGAFTVADTSGNVSTTGTLNADGATTLAAVTTSGNLTVGGNLTVSGTTTTVDSTVVEVADPIMTLGTSGSDDNLDRGLKLKYHNGTDAKNAFFGMDDSTDEFVYIHDATDTSSVMSGSFGSAAFGSLRVTDLTDNRVLIGGTSGEIEDSANLTFNGSTLAVAGATTVSTTLGVSGATTLSSTLDVTGAATFDGDVTLGNAGADTITVTGTTTFSQPADFDGGFTVAGSQTLDAGSNRINSVADPSSAQDAATKAYVDSQVSAGFTLSDGSTTQTIAGGDTMLVSGTANEVNVAVSATDTLTIGLPDDVTIGDAITVTGAATVGTTLGVTGAATLSSTLSAGASTLASASVTGAATVGTTLGVTGATTLSSTLAVTGVTTLTGALDANSTADISDTLTLSKASGTGLSVTSNAAITGNATIGGTLGVTGTLSSGAATLSSAKISDLTSGRVVLAGTSGEIEDSGNLTFDGSELSVTGTAAVSSNATVGGTLGVTGESTLASATVSDLTSGRVVLAGTSGAIEDSGNFTFDGSTMTVTGVMTSTGNANVGGNLDVTGNAVIDGNLTVSGTTTTIDSTVVEVADPIMTLGSDSADDNLDRGIKMKWHNGTDAKIAFMGYDDSATEFVMIADATDTSSVMSGSLASTAVGSLRVTDLTDNRVLIAGSSGEVEDSGNLTFDGSALAVTGTAAVSSNATVGGTLGVTGESTLASATVSDLTSGRVVLAGTAGAIEDSGNLTFNGTTLAVTGNETVSGTMAVTGTLSSGAATLSSAKVSDLTNNRVVIAGTSGEIEDDANFTFDGTTLTVGATTVAQASGNTSVGGTLGVTGATTLSSTLNAGASTLASATISGAATVGTTLGVTGATGIDGDFDINTNKFTVASATGNTVIAGTLGVTGDSTLTGALTANGTNTLDNATISNAATVGTTLGVTGATTLSSTLSAGASTLASASVTGNGTVGGTLDVTGATTFAGAVTINDAGADVDVRIEGATDANLFTTDAGTDTVLIGTATPVTGSKLVIGSTDSFMLAKGTTGQRPTGVTGMFRFNTTNSYPEYYDGSDWKQMSTEFTVIATESFDGDGSTTAFTLGSAQTTASCIVSINGVVQLPTSAYSVSSTTLTFTEAPASGDKIEVRQLTTTETINGISNSGGTAAVETTDGSSVLTVTASTANFSGNIVASGSITANGDLVFGDAGTDSVTFNADVASHIIPDATNTYNLGSSSVKWANVYATTFHGDATLSGTPTAPTAAANTNTTQIATTAYVQTEITDLIGGAPGALDTLNELAAAIDDDSSYASTITTNLATKQAIADCVSTNTADKVVKRDGSGNFAAGTITATCTTAQYADLAENYSADADYAPGTVVCFGGDAEVTQCNEDGDRRIAGVVSTDPAYVMNSTLEGTKATVALQGRVPCKVTGSVRKGDMMVSAGNGMARAEADPKMGSVIGKALENSEGENTIEVVIGRV